MKRIILKSILIPMLLVFFGSFAQETRIEHDLLGERNVPTEYLYGIQTPPRPLYQYFQPHSSNPRSSIVSISISNGRHFR